MGLGTSTSRAWLFAGRISIHFSLFTLKAERLSTAPTACTPSLPLVLELTIPRSGTAARALLWFLLWKSQQIISGIISWSQIRYSDIIYKDALSAHHQSILRPHNAKLHMLLYMAKPASTGFLEEITAQRGWVPGTSLQFSLTQQPVRRPCPLQPISTVRGRPGQLYLDVLRARVCRSRYRVKMQFATCATIS